jgi:hypothetical protein
VLDDPPRTARDGDDENRVAAASCGATQRNDKVEHGGA